MARRLKGIIQYTVMIVIMLLLLWFSLQNIQSGGDETKWSYIVSVWDSADKGLLIISALIAMLSHVVRAERWKLLLSPLGYKITFKNSFLSVMVGYFINLAIPRGGEFTRCYNLYRLDKTPIDKSFGTVMAERAVDVVFLLLFIGLAFIIELDNLTAFMASLNEMKADGQKEGGRFPWMIILISLLVIGIVITILLKKYKSKSILIWKKIKKIFIGVKKGLVVVFSLEKNTLFIVYSVLIWGLYYLMSYFILMAFPETSELGFLAVLTIFALGGIAMAMPLPGGTGSYHVIVPAGLVFLYGFAEDKATAFTVIFHGWQTLIFIIFGLISLILSHIISKRRFA